MRTLTIMIGLLMIVPTLSGCFAGEKIENIEESGPFSFEEGEISMTTWYHYPGTVSNPIAVDATNPDAVLGANLSVNLSGDNIPYYASGTYYGTGWDTFEPTLGITSSGAIFFTNYN